MSALLEFNQVTKRFDGRQVLSGVSFSVHSGEAVGLVGVNGAGKTTLIRGLLDLNRIDSGTIAIAGLAHTVTAARRKLSYLAERFQPPHFATGYELLKYMLALHGLPLQSSAAIAEATSLGLSVDALARPAREYSKGMTQKLGLIACILANCPLLVLDEPMSGLDPQARALFKQRLSALKGAGVTLFFSTHLLLDVESLCDRVLVLDGGRIVWDGRPRALLAETEAGSLEEAFLQLISRAG